MVYLSLSYIYMIYSSDGIVYSSREIRSVAVAPWLFVAPWSFPFAAPDTAIEGVFSEPLPSLCNLAD